MKNLSTLDTTVLIDGTLYKIGGHGLPFRFNGHEWLKSSTPAELIIAEIKKAQRRKRG
jgi:hypothetical protein